MVIEKLVVREGGLRTVLCDVGDVIVTFDLTVGAEIMVHHGLEPNTLVRAALKSPAGRAAMVGAIDDDECGRRLPWWEMPRSLRACGAAG